MKGSIMIAATRFWVLTVCQTLCQVKSLPQSHEADVLTTHSPCLMVERRRGLERFGSILTITHREARTGDKGRLWSWRLPSLPNAWHLSCAESFSESSVRGGRLGWGRGQWMSRGCDERTALRTLCFPASLSSCLPLGLLSLQGAHHRWRWWCGWRKTENY